MTMPSMMSSPQGSFLNGREARAARDGRVQLKGAFVTVRNGELWLNNASFSLVLNSKGEGETTVDTSPRKLLAHQKQIDELIHRKQEGDDNCAPQNPHQRSLH